MPAFDAKDARAARDRHLGTGSTTSLVKLVLSLWNPECGFSVRACDEDRTALALVRHFAACGDDSERLLLQNKRIACCETDQPFQCLNPFGR